MARQQNNLKTNDTQINVDEFRAAILDWYKRHARRLPWRASFGEFPAPYHEWLSEIMLQQTVVKAVIPYFVRFVSLWPTVHDLAAVPQEEVMREWAGLGYYARARNLHKCAKVVSEEYGGSFPKKEEELLKLPGIGPYTAAAISAIAYGQPSTVMDGNIERVLARIFNHQKPIRETKKELYACAQYLSQGRSDYPGEYAQGLMDLGADVCTPSSPKCTTCPVSSFCAVNALGIQNQIPVKPVRTKKPTKYGVLYFLENEKGELLFEKREEKGLLGGMMGIPGTEWNETRPDLKNPIKNFQVNHTFTHFHLILEGVILSKDNFTFNNTEQFWYDLSRYDKIGLPSLYSKAVKQYKKFRHT